MFWWDGRKVRTEALKELGFDPASPLLQRLVSLVNTLIGFPRHLSQHVGGFVITRRQLSRLVPIENAAMAERTVIQWDKDDLEVLGFLKVDVLGLGMLTAIRRCFDLIAEYRGRRLTMAAIPASLKRGILIAAPASPVRAGPRAVRQSTARSPSTHEHCRR